jgi:hypothetical protein
MYFESLQERLLDYVRWRVRNGELTERRLAGLIGVSQPHMHHVLKGIRTLSPGIADRILEAMEMSVLDLVTAEDAPLGGMPIPRGPTPPNASGATRNDVASRTGPGLKGSGATGPLPGKSPGPDGRSEPN